MKGLTASRRRAKLPNHCVIILFTTNIFFIKSKLLYIFRYQTSWRWTKSLRRRQPMGFNNEFSSSMSDSDTPSWICQKWVGCFTFRSLVYHGDIFYANFYTKIFAFFTPKFLIFYVKIFVFFTRKFLLFYRKCLLFYTKIFGFLHRNFCFFTPQFLFFLRLFKSNFNEINPFLRFGNYYFLI